MFKFPKIEAASQSSSSGEGGSFDHHHKSAWGYKHLILGAVAIFVYVGGEVAIGSFLVNYFNELLGMKDRGWKICCTLLGRCNDWKIFRSNHSFRND